MVNIQLFTYQDIPRGECLVTTWGEWSPCSAKCGRGRRLRTRLYLSRDHRVQTELTRRLLRDWSQRFAHLQGLVSCFLCLKLVYDEPIRTLPPWYALYLLPRYSAGDPWPLVGTSKGLIKVVLYERLAFSSSYLLCKIDLPNGFSLVDKKKDATTQ